MSEVLTTVDTSGKGDVSRLPALLEELVKTEKSYLVRIRALKSVSYFAQGHVESTELMRSGLCGPSATVCKETRINDHPGLRGKDAVCQY